MASSRASTLSRIPSADQRRQLGKGPPFARIANPTACMDSLTVDDFDQAGRIFPSRRTLVMGVLNVTPDSFSDGGQFTATGRAI